jgi:hypothetical protein
LPITTLVEFVWYHFRASCNSPCRCRFCLATVQTFSELSGRGEITALWAGGMSFTRMLRAPLLWGLVLVGLVFVLQEFLVPGAETKMKELRTQKVAELGVQNNFSIREPKTGTLKRVIQAAAFDPATKTLLRPSVQLYRDRDVYLQISAERGSWDEATGCGTSTTPTSQRFPGKRRDAANSIEYFSQHLQKTVDEVGDPKTLLAQQNSRDEYLANGSFELVSIFEVGGLPPWLGAGARLSRCDNAQTHRGATFGIHDKIATAAAVPGLILVGAPLDCVRNAPGAGLRPACRCSSS